MSLDAILRSFLVVLALAMILWLSPNASINIALESSQTAQFDASSQEALPTISGPLIGTWKAESSVQGTLTLNSNGTGWLELADRSNFFIYSVQGDTLSIRDPSTNEGMARYTFTLSGDTLVLSGPGLKRPVPFVRALSPGAQPVAVRGDADTGPDTVSVVFLSGELQEAKDRPSLLLSFRIRVKTGGNYTNGATEYFSTKHLWLHTPKGKVIETGTIHLYPESCSNICTISYFIPHDEPGLYSIVNDYVGCCGTKQGRVTFTVPPLDSTSMARKRMDKPKEAKKEEHSVPGAKEGENP